VLASPESWLEQAAATIRAGGIVALPFERLFGLAADATNAATVERLAALKGRNPGGSKPISVIVPDEAAVARIATMTPLARELARRHWPGPLTMLLPSVGVPLAALVGRGGLVGVRLPGPCPAMDLARRLDAVLTATSANPPGASDPLSHEQLIEMAGLDLVVPGNVPGPPGSTIVDASGDRPVLIRRGAIRVDGA